MRNKVMYYYEIRFWDMNAGDNRKIITENCVSHLPLYKVLSACCLENADIVSVKATPVYEIKESESPYV